MMKELYLSPEVDIKEFDLKDVIATSPNNGEGVVANQDPTGPGPGQAGWSHYG